MEDHQKDETRGRRRSVGSSNSEPSDDVVGKTKAVARDGNALLVKKDRRAAERTVEVEMVETAVKAVFVEEVAAGEAADELASGERRETDDAV